MKDNENEELRLLYQMMLIRRFEEKSAEMYTKGKIRGFLHLYIGQEAVAVGVMQALHAEDNVLATYREHGQALARGVDPKSIMAEMYGKLEGCSKGRGGSMHLFDIEKRFYGGNAIVAGHLPIAVGMALTSKKQKKKNVTCCFFGEGAAAEGEFHEAMNLAALWDVPLLMVCENNMYAMGTAIRFTHASMDLAKKGEAYGIASDIVDGMNLSSVAAKANELTNLVRETGKPHFMVCNTYRFRAHSMFDAELYRDKTEIAEWKKRDPIPAFRNYLLEQAIVSAEDMASLEKQIEAEVQESVDFAESGSFEPVAEMTRLLYSDIDRDNLSKPLIKTFAE